MKIYKKIVFILLVSAGTVHAMDNSQITQRKKPKKNISVMVTQPDTYLEVAASISSAKQNPDIKKNIMRIYGLPIGATFHGFGSDKEDGVIFTASHGGIVFDTNYVCSLKPHETDKNTYYTKIEKQESECNDSALCCLGLTCLFLSSGLLLKK